MFLLNKGTVSLLDSDWNLVSPWPKPRFNLVKFHPVYSSRSIY